MSHTDPVAQVPLGVQVRQVATEVSRNLTGGSQAHLWRALDILLPRLEATAWPAMLGRFSSLCTDNCPIEFTFSSSDDAVRFTTEVAGPEVAERLRLDSACACLEDLGLPTPSPALLSEWRSLQTGTLRWGAWLGLRIYDGTLAAKLYIEVPRERRDWGSRPITPNCRLHMVGFDPARNLTELYYRTCAQDDIDHRALLGIFHQHECWPQILDAFSSVCGMPGESALRWMRFGYSLRQNWNQALDGGLTVLADPEPCGGPVAARNAMISSMTRERLLTSPYARLFANLSPDRLPPHGLVSVSSDVSGEVELRTGISTFALDKLIANAIA